MDIPRLGVLSKYWKQHPALHQMVQSFMGIETESEQGKQPSDSVDDLPAFIAAFNNAGGMVN